MRVNNYPDQDQIDYIMEQLSVYGKEMFTRVIENMKFFQFQMSDFYVYFDGDNKTYKLTDGQLVYDKDASEHIIPDIDPSDFVFAALDQFGGDYLKLISYLDSQLDAYKRGDYDSYLALKSMSDAGKIDYHLDKGDLVLEVRNGMGLLFYQVLDGELVPLANSKMAMNGGKEITLDGFTALAKNRDGVDVRDIHSKVLNVLSVEEKVESIDDEMFFYIISDFGVVTLKLPNGKFADFIFENGKLKPNDFAPKVFEAKKQRVLSSEFFTRMKNWHGLDEKYIKTAIENLKKTF